MSGVFCTNNAQAPSLFSNVTLEKREGACALFVQKTPDMKDKWGKNWVCIRLISN